MMRKSSPLSYKFNIKGLSTRTDGKGRFGVSQNGFYDMICRLYGSPYGIGPHGNTNKKCDWADGMIEPHNQGSAPGTIPKQLIHEPYVRHVPKIKPDTTNVWDRKYPKEFITAEEWVGPNGRDDSLSARRFGVKFKNPTPLSIEFQRSIPLKDSVSYKRHHSQAAATLTTKRNAKNSIAQANAMAFHDHIHFAKTRTFLENKPEYTPLYDKYTKDDPIQSEELQDYVMNYRRDHLGLKSHNALGYKPHRVFQKRLPGETAEEQQKRAITSY